MTLPPASATARPPAGARPRGMLRKLRERGQQGDKTWSLAFTLYCLFTVSYFLHLGKRLDILGTLRIDLLLTVGTVLALFVSRKSDATAEKPPMQTTTKLLLAICAYVIITLPLVQWPGSVIDHGFEPFIKAAAFYLLTLQTVTTEKRLHRYLVVFLGVQVFRVLEPLYLHITTGYWGSFTDMGNWEYMNRLSGAPFDIINSNGLAFVILVCVSLMHHLLAGGNWKAKLLYGALLGALVYAMVLTASRSGMLVLAIFGLMIIWNSKHRTLSLIIVGIIIAIMFANMDDLERQRYLSIVDHSAKGGATAEGRVAGLWTDLGVGFERPLFGHGLGTSAEANYNAYGEALPSHTLYTEVLQELGLIGLGIYVAFLVVVLRNCVRAVRRARESGRDFIGRVAKSARDFGVLLLIFSIASFGFSEYQWYFLAALSVVLQRFAERDPADSAGTAVADTTTPATRGRARLPAAQARTRRHSNPVVPR